MKVVINGYETDSNKTLDLPALPRKGDYVQIKGVYYKVSNIVFSEDTLGRIDVQVHVGRAIKMLPSSDEE